MAKTLSKSGIATGQTIEASEVSQSIDAFTGADDYDITISGSLTITGSTSIDGDVFINPTSANTGTSVLTINPTTGKIFRTGSYSAGGGGVGTLDQVTTLGSSTTNAITTGNITSTGIISASGNLFTNVDDSSMVFGASSFKVVTYDTATGRFYRTGSFTSVLVSSGSKINLGGDEIVYGDGSGGEGVGIKGTGSKTVEITDKDGNGGKLDVGGLDGTGVIIVGDTGEIKGGDNKGELKPGSGDGEWEVLKEDGTKGEISTNIKAGTNTTIIDDNYHSTGYIELTGSIYTKSNITASGAISASGNLIAKKIIVDAEGSDPADLDIQIGSSNTGIASIPAGNQIGLYTGGSYRLLANNSEVQISTELKVDKDTIIRGNLNLSGSTPSNITASGTISASGDVLASSFSGDGSGLTNVTASLSIVGTTPGGSAITLNGPNKINFTGNAVTAVTPAPPNTENQINILIETGSAFTTLNVGTGVTEISSSVISLPNLPTSDPGIPGRVWRDGTDLKISV